MKTKPVCDAPGCDKLRKYWTPGYCSTHASRMQKYGRLDLDPHQRKSVPPEVRIARKVTRPNGDDGCWLYTGAPRRNGYAPIALGRRGEGMDYVHRIAYRAAKGPIPDGFEIDHICHDPLTCTEPGFGCPHRRCVNPAHLKAVPPIENLERRAKRQATQTHCKWGHPFSPETDYINPQGKRRCGPCKRKESTTRCESLRQQTAQRRAAKSASSTNLGRSA